MLKTGLNTNLKLETRIDPTVILRAELIELPVLQLESRIDLEMSLNPFLEENTELDLEENKENDEIAEDANKEDEVDWEEIVRDFSNYEDNYPQMYDKDNEDNNFQQPYIKTLKDSLYEQLFENEFTEKEIEIAQEIIGNLDEIGYLACPLQTIISKIEDADQEMVELTLKKVQNLEPVGIAARDVRECLIAQLLSRNLYMEDTYIVLRDYYNDFVNKKYEWIMKRTNISKEQMQEIIEEIKTLNPKPGVSRAINHWESPENQVDKRDLISPDFLVREIDGELVVVLNDYSVPSLKINQTYSNLILSENTSKTTKDFVKKKLESARWFINAINQRKQTLLKVMRSILKFQDDFFKKGPDFLKPMILKDVAEDIEMDVATVSRCTKDKYVDTEHGLFELKYFFTEGLATTDGGEDVSTTVIKEKIRDLVKAEDKKKPLSDQKMADLLKADGHNVARRTVQKYREQLKIPTSRLRKEIF